MSSSYSVEFCKELERRFDQASLFRPMRLVRYEQGTELRYLVQAVDRDERAYVRLVVERFVGGGFAGQVYQVRVLAVEPQEGDFSAVQPGAVYAMKILVPPSGFARWFRNLVYWIGFQGPFQLQINPAAAQAGALWQKFIRRAAKLRFGSEQTVVDIYGTFVDEQLGSCGELSEWVDGRTWRLEVDDRLDLLRRWLRGKPVDEQLLGSPEFRAKYQFMHRFVALLHEMGAHEFARQYEWSTCKSQPNCLKRQGTDEDPQGGLVAVDFRAGLALLPFLPMSPGDVKLIWQGLRRGSLVQFDRGDIHRLEDFVSRHQQAFSDMEGLLEKLRQTEQVYRDSLVDITHHRLRLLYSRRLWKTILSSAITGWRIRGIVDQTMERRCRRSSLLTVLFGLMMLLPVVGKVLGRMLGHRQWRQHYVSMIRSGDYLQRAIAGKVAEKVLQWHRDGRISEQTGRKIVERFGLFLAHLPLTILPAGLHRFVTDVGYAKQSLVYWFVRPVRLYFNAELREQWLRQMLLEGQHKHMLSEEDAQTIVSQLGEPFIQKYLKSLAVHLCTLPVTQVVSVFIAVVFVLTHPDMPRAEAWAVGIGIIALFQVVPISPGSLVRGLYVVYLVVRERNFKDYNIAVFLGFFKYVGYLAFPIQMTYRYPALARFMAAHWATEAVHIVPVFGERGALLEHWIFRLFYNWPLTIRRRLRRRAQWRSSLPSRYWHVAAAALAGVGCFAAVQWWYLQGKDVPAHLIDIWPVTVLVPLAAGAITTLGCGGASLGRRVAAGAICGVIMGALYGPVLWELARLSGIAATIGWAIRSSLWGAFVFSILGVIGVIAVELQLPDPPAE